MTEESHVSPQRTARNNSADDKSLLNSDYKPEYEVDELYERMGNTARSTCIIIFLISLFGEMCAPFGVIAPILQTEVPGVECLKECNSTVLTEPCVIAYPCPNTSREYICELPRESWRWNNSGRSLISEFNLYCKNPLYVSVAQLIFFIPGMAIGLIFTGYLSDKIGRKKGNMIMMSGACIASLGMGFSVSFEMFLVFQAFLGLTLGGTMVTRVVWMLEFVAESVRAYASAISAQFFCIGTVLVAVADFYLQDWRLLDFIIAVYSFIYVLVMVVVPESPHWLVTNQKTDELNKVIKRLNNINTKKISLEEIKVVPVKKHNESGNICLIFSDVRTFTTLLGIMYQWFLASFLYYAFFNLAGLISGVINWNIAIMGILEGPCILMAGLLTTKLGRKVTLFIMLGVIILSSMISLFDVTITKDWDLRRIFTLIGSKFGTGPMFFVIYILTLEVLPTSIRSIGMSTCSFIGRLGAGTAPLVIKLCEQAFSNLHYVVFIGLCVVGIVVAYLLPETKGTVLKQTFSSQHAGLTDTAKGNNKQKDEEIGSPKFHSIKLVD